VGRQWAGGGQAVGRRWAGSGPTLEGDWMGMSPVGAVPVLALLRAACPCARPRPGAWFSRKADVRLKRAMSMSMAPAPG